MAEIGRRGFLGMAVGGAVAGPGAVRNIGQQAMRSQSYIPLSLAGETDESRLADQRTWLSNRLAELKQRRERGPYSDDVPPDFNSAIHENINSLRSVSPAHKEIMREAARKRYEEQRYRWFIDNEIKELMGRAKILGIPIL